MRIYLIDQSPKLVQHLDVLKTTKVMPYDKDELKEVISTIVIDTAKKLAELNLDFLFDYQIFPPHIMAFKTQWAVEKRVMQVGDTIAQQVYIPPTKVVSQKIVFGVRINQLINQPNKIGFSYETPEGHVEKGVSTFTVEEIDDKIVFKIHTYSKPGNLLATLLGPIFSTPYQAYCTNAALENVKEQLQVL